MKEFLEKLGITKEGEYTDDNNYFIDLEDDDTYAKVFSLLERSNEVEEDTDASQLTSENSSIQYVNDRYAITILVDYESDQYALICREN